MKNTKTILLVLSLTLANGMLFAEEEKRQAGPNGGLLLETDPRAEFFVNDERKVEVSFLDADLKPVDPGERTVRVTTFSPSGQTVIEFEKEKEKEILLSKEALPDGDGYMLVVQLFETPEARPENFRVVYETHVCSGCDLEEYACICEH